MPLSALASAPWPVLLVGAWLLTIMIIATVIYLIARSVIHKSDPRDLPEVLRALAPLLTGTARSLNKLPGSAALPVDEPTDQAAGTERGAQ